MGGRGGASAGSSQRPIGSRGVAPSRGSASGGTSGRELSRLAADSVRLRGSATAYGQQDPGTAALQQFRARLNAEVARLRSAPVPERAAFFNSVRASYNRARRLDRALTNDRIDGRSRVGWQAANAQHVTRMYRDAFEALGVPRRAWN